MSVRRIDCDHGQLARQCPICERDQRIQELERERNQARRDADERRDMVECTNEMTLRDLHQLAQEGCRFFYLRPKS